MATSGWRPLQQARPGAEAFQITPFTRLARTHALAVAGDTLVAIALAGTLFFSIDVGEARGEVFLYLALTMAPFAIVAPLVGPALDRHAGGRRLMVIGVSALRSVVCLLMMDHVDSLLLFPLAFVLLVLAKSHQVAKSALVPTTVRSHEGLVEANSKLSLISGVVGFAAAVPGALLLRFGGSEWVLGLAAIVFAVGVAFSWQLPRVQVAAEPETEAGKAELRSAAVLLAASAMGLLRGVVGFLTFLLAFSLRTDGSPTWHFGVVLAASGAGGLAGAALAPVLRRSFVEERILTGLLVAVAAVGLVGAWLGSLLGAAVVGLAVALGAAGAKQAFDSIVQRDAPDANRGRSFARFETRFQLIWVAGAVLGIAPMPMWLGFLIVAGTAAFAAASYTAGSRGTRLRAERRRRRAERAERDEDGEDDAPPPVPPSIATPSRTDRAASGGNDDPTRVEDEP
jgi:MFS family permease